MRQLVVTILCPFSLRGFGPFPILDNGRPIFIQCWYCEELGSLYMRVPNPSPVLDRNREPMGPQNLIQLWGWGLEEGS